jgi:hypothetical protein
MSPPPVLKFVVRNRAVAKIERPEPPLRAALRLRSSWRSAVIQGEHKAGLPGGRIG